MYNSSIRKYVAKSISLKDVYYDLIISQKKISTSRYGYVLFDDIVTSLTFNSKPSINIVIKKIDFSKTFGSIDNMDAENDGYDSLDKLKMDIQKYYPEIKQDSPLTIIYFDLL